MLLVGLEEIAATFVVIPNAAELDCTDIHLSESSDQRLPLVRTVMSSTVPYRRGIRQVHVAIRPGEQHTVKLVTSMGCFHFYECDEVHPLFPQSHSSNAVGFSVF
jgi:hypothetical protein